MSKDVRKEGKRISPQARSVLVSGRYRKTAKTDEKAKVRKLIEYKPLRFERKKQEIKTEPTKPALSRPMLLKQKQHPVVIKGRIKKYDKKEEEERARKVRKSLNYSTSEGVFNSASSSITESYITPFALALKATNLEIGLLFSMKNLMNTIAQIPGARLTQFFGRKQIWFFSQIFSKILLWIPILLLPFIAPGNAVALLIILFAATGFFAALRSPAWSSMMGDLVPLKIRGSYFGTRNTATGIAGVIATLGAGFLLAYYGFTLIFIIAIMLAAVSIPFFLKMYEPPFRKIYHYRHRFALKPEGWTSAIRTNRSLAIFTVYMFCMYFATEIASPFYAVYMLRDLQVSYVWFAALTVVGALARIASYKYWGKLTDKYGSRKILLISGFFACFAPLGWTMVYDVFSIAALRIFDGLVWSGFDMVVFNYLLGITPAEKRPQYIANHNFFTGIGIILGTAAGGLLAEAWAGSSFMWLHGLQIVFMLSFLLRIICLLLLPMISDIAMDQRNIPVQYIFWQAVAVEPARNIMHIISYTFRYPYIIERKFRKEIQRLRFKLIMMRS